MIPWLPQNIPPRKRFTTGLHSSNATTFAQGSWPVGSDGPMSTRSEWQPPWDWSEYSLRPSSGARTSCSCGPVYLGGFEQIFECPRGGYELGRGARAALSDTGYRHEGFPGFRMTETSEQCIIQLNVPIRRINGAPSTASIRLILHGQASDKHEWQVTCICRVQPLLNAPIKMTGGWRRWPNATSSPERRSKLQNCD